MAEERHLEYEEAKTLMEYLLANALSLEEIDEEMRVVASVNRDTAMSISSRVDQEREKTKAYESSSSFGRTTREIMTNARAHFLSCPDCIDRYRSAIDTRDHETLEDMTRYFQPLIEEFKELLERRAPSEEDLQKARLDRLRNLDMLGVI